jgi:hypothetical protein
MPVHDWTRVDAGTFHAFHTLSCICQNHRSAGPTLGIFGP